MLEPSLPYKKARLDFFRQYWKVQWKADDYFETGLNKRFQLYSSNFDCLRVDFLCWVIFTCVRT